MDDITFTTDECRQLAEIRAAKSLDDFADMLADGTYTLNMTTPQDLLDQIVHLLHRDAHLLSEASQTPLSRS